MTQIQPHDLGDGLVLRQATPSDIERLVTFNAAIHKETAPAPDDHIAAWTRDLVDGRHPSTSTGDVTIVEDARSNQIVSSAMLVSQTWSYADIPMAIGQLELIGTAPTFRRRGLVRAQMQRLHRLSAEKGHQVQVIRGIPYFYRQFGYEYALSMNEGRAGYPINLPALQPHQLQKYRIRPVVAEDLPFIISVDRLARARHLVACVRTSEQWRYELFDRSPRSKEYRVARLIETTDGQPAGYLLHYPQLEPRLGGHPTFLVDDFELRPEHGWHEATQSAFAYVATTARDYARSAEKPWEAFGFPLGPKHPVYDVIPRSLPVSLWRYGWYVRIQNLPAFLLHIAPVLERRLATSILAGYSGELKVSFYRSGIKLTIDHGHLDAVGALMPTELDTAPSMFPDLSFVQLLFGYRTLEELEYAFTDCQTFGDRNRLLLTVLFPKHTSRIRAAC